MKTSTIIFAGHFTVGEKTNATQLKTIKDAQVSNDDLAILVNDIDFKRKLRFYEIGGKEMVIKHYGSRKKCGNTSPLCELPEYNKLPNLIDWDFYNLALAKIKRSPLSTDEILRKEIIPLAIKQKQHEYKIEKEPLIIFTERELRNLASQRLSNSRKNGGKSWIPLAEEAKILPELKSNISNIPVCGSIMLALYEQLTKRGYLLLKQLYAKEEKIALENGKKLCQILHQNSPQDPRWKIKITNQYF